MADSIRKLQKPSARALFHVWAAAAAPAGFPFGCTPDALTLHGGIQVLSLGPRRWLLAGDARHLDNWCRGAAADVHVHDVSDAWVIIRISHAGCADLLSRHCPLDLAGILGAGGGCLATLFDDTRILLARAPAANEVELYVGRSYSQHVWECLAASAKDLGFETLPAVEEWTT